MNLRLLAEAFSHRQPAGSGPLPGRAAAVQAGADFDALPAVDTGSIAPSGDRAPHRDLPPGGHLWV